MNAFRRQGVLAAFLERIACLLSATAGHSRALPIRSASTTAARGDHSHLPAGVERALEAASKSLFFSLPVAFDPAQSIAPTLDDRS